MNCVPRETETWLNLSHAQILQQGAFGLGIFLTPVQIESLLNYFQELLRWNRRMNLIARDLPQKQLVIHVLDCLTPEPHLDFEPRQVLDLGSGAGLPGLVLKIIKPHWSLTLAEAKTKRCAFLNHIVRTMDLKAIRVRAGRLTEKSRPSDSWIYDLVVFRGLGKLQDILPLAVSYLSTRGRILAYKGPAVDLELSSLGDLLETCGLVLAQDVNLSLPFLSRPRRLLFFSRKQS